MRGPFHNGECKRQLPPVMSMKRTRRDNEVERRLGESCKPIARVPIEYNGPCTASGLPVIIRPAAHP